MHENIDLKRFYEEVVNRSYYHKKYPNWRIDEMPIEGALKRMNADKIYMGVGYGSDFTDEIIGAYLVCFMYSEELKSGFEVSNHMNFTTMNNNFKLKERIWSHLL